MIGSPNQKGRSNILRFKEECVIVERTKLAASRGFAIDCHGVKAVIAHIAADGRKSYNNGVSSDSAVRSFRARHRDITCRRAEQKEHSKLKAESYGHVESYFPTLETIGVIHPGILSEAKRVWNMYEINVSAIEGNVKKFFTSAVSHHGGFCRTRTTYGMSKNVTAVVGVSSLGVKAPRFFILAGKKISSRWLEPVTGSFGGHVHGICRRFTRENWFPNDGEIKVSENGSMEKPTLCAFVEHINNFARSHCESGPYLLCLDEHSSREEAEWIVSCMDKESEAVVSPANTSHFLQLCDKTVNRKFKKSLKEIRDAFCNMGMFDTTQVNFNLACGLYAFECITSTNIVKSFEVTGVFPFDRSFPLQYKTCNDILQDTAEAEHERLERAGPSSRIRSVIKRRSDTETLRELQRIMTSGKDAARVIQKASIAIKRTETTNAILMRSILEKSTKCTTNVSTNKETRYYMTQGLQQNGLR